MNPVLPSYQFLPAPLWLIDTLHILTLTLHLAAMGLLFGGVMVFFFGRAADRWDSAVVPLIRKSFPTLMAATITLGIAPLLFVQLVFPQPIYSASIVSGWFWLLIIAALIVAYYCLYAAGFSKSAAPCGKYLAVALLGMVYVSLVYSSVFSLAERPDTTKALYAANQAGLAFHADHAHWLLRWMHMISGILAIGGFFIRLAGQKDPKASEAGRRFFLGGMILAIVFGCAYLLVPAGVFQAVRGGPALWTLTLAVLLALAAMHLSRNRSPLWAGLFLFLSMLGMVATRHFVRLALLEKHFRPDSVPVSPQWVVFGLFLVCFVLALGTLYYMTALFFRATKATSK